MESDRVLSLTTHYQDRGFLSVTNNSQQSRIAPDTVSFVNGLYNQWFFIFLFHDTNTFQNIWFNIEGTKYYKLQTLINILNDISSRFICFKLLLALLGTKHKKKIFKIDLQDKDKTTLLGPNFIFYKEWSCQKWIANVYEKIFKV